MAKITEDRQAGAGERILVSYAFGTGGAYSNGDILTVECREDDGVRVEEHDMWISDDEYVVLTESYRHHDLYEEIEQLKERVAALEGQA